MHALQRNLVIPGIAGINLVLCQPVRFSAEAADAFTAAQKVCEILSLYPLQLLGSGAVFQESSHLLIDRFFYLIEGMPGPRRDLHYELAADLTCVGINSDVTGNLVVVNQPLIEA